MGEQALEERRLQQVLAMACVASGSGQAAMASESMVAPKSEAVGSADGVALLTAGFEGMGVAPAASDTALSDLSNKEESCDSKLQHACINGDLE